MAQTIKELLAACTKFLEGKGLANSRFHAEEAIASALGMKRLELYMYFDRSLSEDELAKCREYVKRRGEREPIQYIEGVVDFADIDVLVDPSVLIPRPESEQLVYLIAEQLKNEDLENKVLLDLCSGSGCIGLALKKRFPKLSVVLSDISEQAVELAQKNSRQNGLPVEILQGDLLEPFSGRKCDYLVCNPPYVSAGDYEDLAPEIREHEPKIALLAGEDDLVFYRRLSLDLPSHLNPKAKIWLKMGYDQGERVLRLFSSKPWKKQALIKDFAGIYRFFSLEIE